MNIEAYKDDSILEEENDINYKVTFEMLDIQYKVIPFSLLCHLLILLIIIPVIYNKIELIRLLIWGISLVIVDSLGFLLLKAYQGANKNHQNIQSWRIRYLCIAAVIEAVWGSLGFFMMHPSDITAQFFIIFLIFALSAAFSQGTITDIISCRLSILLILSPLIVWCLLKATSVYYGMAVILLVYMAFLFFVTTQGHKLLKESLILRYKNIALSEKLEKANTILEQKVAERTEELKAAKAEAEAANRAKTEFLGIVSHELRTPLRVIESAAGGLKKYVPKLMEGYRIAKQAGLSVEDVTEEEYQALLLALGNIEKETEASFNFIKMLLGNLGRMSDVVVENTLCSMSKCINLALERYPFVDGEKELIGFDINEEFSFSGDEILMVHILFNLIKNALQNIQETGKGRIQILLTSDTKYNRLHFRDTAAGINSSELSRIFERYYSKATGDTELGLAFCRMIITSFGGTISCQVKDNDCCEFILEFPCNYSK